MHSPTMDLRALANSVTPKQMGLGESAVGYHEIALPLLRKLNLNEMAVVAAQDSIRMCRFICSSQYNLAEMNEYIQDRCDVR